MRPAARVQFLGPCSGSRAKNSGITSSRYFFSACASSYHQSLTIRVISTYHQVVNLPRVRSSSPYRSVLQALLCWKRLEIRC